MKKFIFALLWCFAIQAQTFDFSCNENLQSINLLTSSFTGRINSENWSPLNHVVDNIYLADGILFDENIESKEIIIGAYRNAQRELSRLDINNALRATLIILDNDSNKPIGGSFGGSASNKGLMILNIGVSNNTMAVWERVILHEMVHAFHWILLSDNYNNQEVIDLFNNAVWNDSRSAYYKINPAEFLAEAIQEYKGYFPPNIVSHQQIKNENYYTTNIVPFLDTLFN